jgi:hypothetical protein
MKFLVYANSLRSARSARLALAIGLVLTLVGQAVVPPLAVAAPPLSAEEDKARQEALELFKQGRNAYKAGDYDAARELFARAFARYDKEPLIALALAKAYDRAAQHEKALLYYEYFLRLAPVDAEFSADREATIKRIAEVKLLLQSRPGILKLRNLPPAARVTIDDAPADADASGEIRVAAGEHRIRIVMEQRVPFERPAVSVGPGETREIEVVLPPWIDPSTLPKDHTYTWILAATTGAAAVTTGVLGYLTWRSSVDYSAAFDGEGQPNEATRKKYSWQGQPCRLGVQVQTLPGLPFECEASGAVKAGQTMADRYDQRFTGMIISGGATLLLAGGTAVAWALAPTRADARSANTQRHHQPKVVRTEPLLQRVSIVPVWQRDGGGAVLGLRF